MILTTGVCVPISAAAETIPMTWKPMDKAYVSIVFDDNNTELERIYKLVTEEYGFPLCAAVPVKSFDKTLSSSARPESLELLHKIQDNGGEILSHNLTHKVFNRDVPWTTVDYELGESYRRLTAEGFRVNGVILAGGGGTEDRSAEYRAELEKYTSKYYKYSDLYGVSTQYYHPRRPLYDNNQNLIRYIDEAIENKQWLVLSGHGIEKEIQQQSEKKIRVILDYLKEKQNEGVLEVVTYRDVHKTFADWASPVDLDTIPPKPTTTTTTTTTGTVNSTTTTTTRTSRSAPTFATSTTSTAATIEDTPEPQPDVSTGAAVNAQKENKSVPAWIPWAIAGGAALLVVAVAVTILAVSKNRKKRTSPTE